MVVTTGVFMGKLGKQTQESVGKLIGENIQNQVIGMCSGGWTGVLPRLSAPCRTCVEAPLMIKATQSYAQFSAPTIKSRDTLMQRLHNIPLSSLATKSTVLVHTPIAASTAFVCCLRRPQSSARAPSPCKAILSSIVRHVANPALQSVLD